MMFQPSNALSIVFIWIISSRGIFWENQNFELFFWQSDWTCVVPTLQMTNPVSPKSIWVCLFRIWRPLMNPTLRFFWKSKWKNNFSNKNGLEITHYEVAFWSIISWKSIKVTLSCREIISTCRMIIYLLPKDFLDSK